LPDQPEAKICPLLLSTIYSVLFKKQIELRFCPEAVVAFALFRWTHSSMLNKSLYRLIISVNSLLDMKKPTAQGYELLAGIENNYFEFFLLQLTTISGD